MTVARGELGVALDVVTESGIVDAAASEEATAAAGDGDATGVAVPEGVGDTVDWPHGG